MKRRSQRRHFDEPAQLWGGLRLFISYSHSDAKMRGKLESHLTLMRRQGLIRIWTDRVITPGSNWKDAIDGAIHSSQIVLLLVSASFMSSDYCYEIEAKTALERDRQEMAKAIPVILRPVDWRSGPFGHLQALPENGRPITLWSNRDAAFFSVATGIRTVIEAFADQLLKRAVDVEIVHDVAIFRLRRRLTAGQLVPMVKLIQVCVAKDRISKLLINLQSVDYIDSVGLSILVAAATEARISVAQLHRCVCVVFPVGLRTCCTFAG